MSEKETHLYLPADSVQNGQITIVQRAGQALQEVQLKKVEAKSVSIYGPAQYIRKNYTDLLKQMPTDEGNFKAMIPGILYYKLAEADDTYYIRFDEFPDHPINGAVIIGKMVVNPELTGWGLNSGQFMTPDTFVDFVRKRAHHFTSVKEAQDLVNLARNFEATFETIKTQKDDGRGNVEKQLKDQIKFSKDELPKQLRIVLPLFSGCPSVTLNLEIELTRKGNEPCMAFYCLELETMKREQATSIMQDELQPFANFCVQLREV